MTAGSNGRLQTGHITENEAPVDAFTYIMDTHTELDLSVCR